MINFISDIKTSKDVDIQKDVKYEEKVKFKTDIKQKIESDYIETNEENLYFTIDDNYGVLLTDTKKIWEIFPKEGYVKLKQMNTSMKRTRQQEEDDEREKKKRKIQEELEEFQKSDKEQLENLKLKNLTPKRAELCADVIGIILSFLKSTKEFQNVYYASKIVAQQLDDKRGLNKYLKFTIDKNTSQKYLKYVNEYHIEEPYTKLQVKEKKISPKYTVLDKYYVTNLEIRDVEMNEFSVKFFKNILSTVENLSIINSKFPSFLFEYTKNLLSLEIYNMQSFTSFKTGKEDKKYAHMISKCDKIVKLKIKVCDIFKFPKIKSMQQLKFLEVDDNYYPITDDVISNLVNLEVLSISNPKEFVGTSLKNLKKLKELYILNIFDDFFSKSVNNICNLENLEKLELSIWISPNRISTGILTGGDANFLVGLPKLKYIKVEDLNYNFQTAKILPNVKEAYVKNSRNFIEIIKFPNLEKFTAEGRTRFFVGLEINYCKKLKHLIVKDSEYFSISTVSSKSLEILDIEIPDYYMYTDNPFYGIRNLKQLKIKLAKKIGAQELLEHVKILNKLVNPPEIIYLKKDDLMDID